MIKKGKTMKKDLKLAPSKPYPMGVTRTENGIRVCAPFAQNKNCGIVLFEKNDKKGTILKFSEDMRYGRVFCAEISGDTDKYSHYMLFNGKHMLSDPYAKYVDGLSKWAKNVDESEIRCRIDEEPYDWGADKKPATKYEDSFVYTLHVRGYTKSPASGIDTKRRGTFAGLCEKADYIKSIGVTAIELMPCYEMNVLDTTLGRSSNAGNMPEGSMTLSAGKDKNLMYSENGSLKNASTVRHKINFWGYKKGFYFAPRTSYASNPAEADIEFKDMVKLFHKKGIEVIMQFYFEETETEDMILSSIRHWVFDYHIDGVHLKGNSQAPAIIAADPSLCDTKIWYYGFDYGKLHASYAPTVRTLGEFTPDFLYATRRFLKGDDNTLGDFLKVMLNNKHEAGIVNYICDYQGFRLADLVTYEHKRNELNGENNTDGENNNLSWNCGIEGKTRKQSILSLRSKQMKNALTMVLLSQGTPMIFGGDEFANSQDGNNNPYCQDNPTGWVDWNMATKPLGIELTEYVKFLTKLRFKHRILHESKPFKLMDYMACGYPDLSYHGIEAWRPDLSNYSHSIGMLYCGFYEKEEKDQDFFYVAYNMHWTPVSFALPKLPEGMKWKLLSDTENSESEKHVHTLKDQDKIECAERSVKILVGVGTPVKKATPKERKKK